VLGHKDSRSAAHYIHLATDTLAAAVERMVQKSHHRAKEKGLTLCCL
jgi:hypothetical protein